MTEDDQDGHLTRESAAAEADVAPGTIDRWLKLPDGPPSYTRRRRVLIPAAPFRAWLKAQVKERVRQPQAIDTSVVSKPIVKIDLKDPSTLRALHAELTRMVEEDRAAGIEIPAIDIRDPAAPQTIRKALQRDLAEGEGGEQ